MKLMISQPMVGRTERDILQERDVLRRFFEKDGHTVLDTYIQQAPPRDSNAGLWYLGRVLELMAECDGVVFAPGWKDARGCVIEHHAAARYGLHIVEM